MVNLVPRNRFVIQTPEALQTVIDRLKAHIESPKVSRWIFDLNHAPYEGSVSESRFEMRRIPLGRKNGCIPEIKGRFETPPGGTVVHITMNPHPLTLIVFVGGFVVWASILLPLWFSGDEMTRYMTLLFLGLFPLILVDSWITFWVEVERSHRDLLRIILGRLPEAKQNRNLIPLIFRGIFISVCIAFFFWLLAEHAAEWLPDFEVPEALRSLQQ